MGASDRATAKLGVPSTCPQAPLIRVHGPAGIRKLHSPVIAALSILLVVTPPVAAQNASTALGVTAERVLGGDAAGVTVVWRALSIGQVGGVPVMVQMRAHATVGAEPETNVGRRLRAKTSASLSVPISSGNSRARIHLFGGIGYAIHKVSNIAPEEADPDLARIEHTFHGFVTEAGLDIEYQLRARTAFWASIGLMRQRLAVEPSAVPQVSIGLLFR